MADYFSEYSSFIGSKGLPSPADTPYETPGFIRSKRSSRATAGSSREQSNSPPPLPPEPTEPQERPRDGRYNGGVDPRRFTPTLHASLVQEILSLRRELETQNSLVENLETTLATAKNENDVLTEQLSQTSKDVRKAKSQVQQMEKGTYDAVEDLVKERDVALSNADDFKTKFEAAQKTVRRQDEDAERTQRIWEIEKESWDNERRQLERRMHVTETRLRTVVNEMTAQQAVAEAHEVRLEDVDDSQFKDSGFGNESDAGSVHSASPAKHRRNKSSLSSLGKTFRNSTTSRPAGTPEPPARPGGYSLADELGIEEEDEYDLDDFDHPDEDLGLEFSERLRKTMESRQSSVTGEMDSKAKRVLGLTTENIDSPLPSPTAREFPRRAIDSVRLSEQPKQALEQSTILPTVSEVKSAPTVQYVDTGYQPSPPASPPKPHTVPAERVIPTIEEPEPESRTDDVDKLESRRVLPEPTSVIVAAASSPPQTLEVNLTPEEDDNVPVSALLYSSASTQTDVVESDQPKGHKSRGSLSPPSYVPSIAIHAPTSRPSSPRTYVLPPGTKNASAQASLPWRSRDVSVQTEGIRVDSRPVKLPAHLLPGHLLPSPTFQEPGQSRKSKRAAANGITNIITKTAPFPSASSPVLAQSPQESSPEKMSRNNSQKDLRTMPLRAIPLPRPILSPPLPQAEAVSEGPLNRSSQYGVTKSGQLSSPLLDVDSELSDNDGSGVDFDSQDLANAIPGIIKPPQGRFGLSEPPKAVPEDKEISPERRPDTAGSYGAAPAPSVASSRTNSRARAKPNTTLNSYKEFRSRSPSFGSRASSSYSTQSAAAPPFPIPNRSSSRVYPNSYSEGSQSPTPQFDDVFGHRSQRTGRSHHTRQNSLRKVQSAAVIRPTRRTSPKKLRRRRRSPDLTPVQSMAFESPGATNFPIPELPTPLQNVAKSDRGKDSVDYGKAPDTAASSAPRASDETNLVDAIAATMVGEWMWKYIRRKKSFGVQEDFPVAEDGTVITTGSSRHKRWVWLSPYERTIMWDSKQPNTNNALLGKKGRKLGIQSVLDVPDDTLLPKNPELRTAYDRSILILTPARALKFTAVSAERHALWMTALSFLAQSGRLPSQIPLPPRQLQSQRTTQIQPQPPPIPAQEPPPIKRNRSPSFGRLTVRDSIRLAKGKRPDLPKSVSQPYSAAGSGTATVDTKEDDSADFPAVPRLYISTARHQRKRSNTSPRLPTTLNGFRSFSSGAIPSTASSALQTASTNSSFFRSNLPSTSSKSGSRNDSLASPDRPNFFEAVGTVRMEAFVDPNVRDGVLYVPAPPPVAPEPRRRGDSNVSQSSVAMDRRRAGHVFDDPFRSFDFTASNEISAR